MYEREAAVDRLRKMTKHPRSLTTTATGTGALFLPQSRSMNSGEIPILPAISPDVPPGFDVTDIISHPVTACYSSQSTYCDIESIYNVCSCGNTIDTTTRVATRDLRQFAMISDDSDPEGLLNIRLHCSCQAIKFTKILHNCGPYECDKLGCVCVCEAVDEQYTVSLINDIASLTSKSSHLSCIKIHPPLVEIRAFWSSLCMLLTRMSLRDINPIHTHTHFNPIHTHTHTYYNTHK
eukprot:GHVR01106348.1.p1 GENE.GHVR01106348.1~~GHVR01106348.1.p1  ORF type:complete len:236 (-),score=54.56 GHVR01106348.1:308-1015(-)